MHTVLPFLQEAAHQIAGSQPARGGRDSGPPLVEESRPSRGPSGGCWEAVLQLLPPDQLFLTGPRKEVRSFLQLCFVWLPFVKYVLLAGNHVRFLGGLQSTANHFLNQLSSLIKLTDGRKRVLGWFILLAVVLQHQGRTYRIEREVAHAERQACHGHLGQRPGRNAMTRPFQVREHCIKRPGIVRGALPWFCRCGHEG